METIIDMDYAAALKEKKTMKKRCGAE